MRVDPGKPFLLYDILLRSITLKMSLCLVPGSAA